jgi:two-component system phosphate regulon sensor histidine kinase PhoR
MGKLSYIKKLAFPYLIILAFGLTVISLVTSRFYGNYVLNSWETEISAEAQLAAEYLTPVLQNYKPNENLSNAVQRLSDITKDRITIILPDGLVVGESAKEPSSLENHLQRPEIQAALAGRSETTIRTSATLHQRLLYGAAPIQSSGILLGVVRLAKPLDEFDRTIEKFNQLLLALAGGVLIISVLLMFVQSSRKINPLGKISEEIHQASLNDLQIIETHDRKDEIGSILLSFNALVVKILHQFSEIRNEQTKLNAILSNMKDGVVLVDQTGNVELINPAAQEMFSIEQKAAIGSSLVEVVRQHQINDMWKKCLDTKETQTSNVQISLDRGHIQATASLIGDVLPGEVLLLFKDLSLIRKLETIRQDFISNISHELRTPLASLKALSETLQDGALRDPEVSSRFLLQMDEEIDDLTQIVQELLELSKIESGKVPLEKKSIKPIELINRPVERMKLQSDRAGIAMEISISSKLPEVLVDMARMQQVIINLIHNAIKFTPPGGMITITAREETDQVVFGVNDTGEGIAEDDLERVFERFYKADRSRSRGGTGLGLSIARHIVETHKGRIWVESEIGKGSTFWFSIPKASSNANP